jgi:hypothetical protein
MHSQNTRAFRPSLSRLIALLGAVRQPTVTTRTKPVDPRTLSPHIQRDIGFSP